MTITLTTADLILELNRRGYICRPKSTQHLNWSRMPVTNEEAFKWEALHEIAKRLTIDHLNITTRNALGEDDKSKGQIITTATLYLY